MPRSKPARPNPPTDLVDGGFVTDRHITALGLDPATVGEQIFTDAAALYDHVQRSPYATREELVRWANGKWETDTVDRLNAAIDFLRESKRLFSIA